MASCRPGEKGVTHFGVFELDLQSGELRKHGIRVKLQDHPLQILQVLLERPGQVVTREELRQRLWPSGTFVEFDKGVYNAVKRLRETLSDDAEAPRYIETIPRQGYRFVAPIKTDATIDQISKSAPNRFHIARRNLAIAIGSSVLGTVSLLIVLLLKLGFVTARHPLPNPAHEIRSLAVLPLQNLSADPKQEYFSDGITDALITQLAQIGSVRIISRTSSMQYKRTTKSLPDIARELNVDALVEGTVQRSGDRIRMTAQLIQGSSDEHLWAHSYERDVHDVFALERDLALEIAETIQAQLKGPNEARLAQPRSVNPKALDAYLRGNYYLNRFSEAQLSEAEEYFKRAIEADPMFAAAYVGMARAQYGRFQLSTNDANIARSAAERALQLDPTLSDAWMTLGQVKLLSWDWSGMQHDYRKAIELNANNAQAHAELGELLDAMGRLDEGVKECEIAQELDPNQDHMSGALDDRHEFDRSIEIKLIMLRNDPDNVVLHHNLYLNYEATGLYKEAVLHLEKAWALGGFPEVASDLRRAFAISGYQGAMRAYARDLEYVHAMKRIFLPVNLAGVYTTLGERNRAFYWLEQAFKHGRGSGIPLWMMRLYPALDPLQSDPRFNNLAHRIGIP